jgi:anti-anti-sigma regulatory factor
MSLSQATDPVTEIKVSREVRGLVVRVLVPLTETHAAVIRREILAAWDGRKDPKGVVLDLCDVGHLDRPSVGMLLELVRRARAARIPFELTTLGTPLITIS